MTTLELKDTKTVPDPIHPYLRNIRNSSVPLVIDNGSYQCRVGWATQKEPLLIFKNLIAKPRKERGKKDGETQVGNDITNIEAVRFQLKTQFDRNVVTHFEAQEQVFDYIFTHLGIDTEGYVNHPIVMTEAFLNPNYSRHLMSELLFECYRVPSVCYGVDGLFSFRHNHPNSSAGLIINFGYHTTHILPVINNQVDPTRSRRINVGGIHIINYLHRLLQLKYPAHFAAITPSRAEELIYEQTFVAVDYQEELSLWADSDHYDNHVRRIQLPYTIQAVTPGLTPEQQKERRKELARRLIEINARKREERLAEDEEQLNQLLAAQDLEEGEENEFQKILDFYELSSGTDLQKLISQLQARIERTKQKIAAANTTEDNVVEDPKPKVIKQTLKPNDQEDFETWIAGVRQKRQEILERRNARRQRRQDMAKRRTAAAQERMRLISQLARKEKRDDNFGMRDEDWDVYKAINKEGGDSDSDEEQKLLELEEALRRHDPEFEGSVSSGTTSANNSGNTAETHQLHVGIERIRAPEILFQPSMIGSGEAGLAETIEFVLRGYPADVQSALVSNVFLTGGCAALPGLSERLRRELLEMRPFKSTFNVTIANNTTLDAWYGAQTFSSSPDLNQYLVTRSEYEERGGEYLKEHYASNKYYPSPTPLPQAESIQLPVGGEEIEIDVF
ncbi:actin-related protein 5 isoform X1 [Periplaneta americana]|uniref:actin-related protein 5 isoform X1 n=1 Tax=Periplaneta americana TaxID=6978 RepID=UPI0037E86C4F